MIRCHSRTNKLYVRHISTYLGAFFSLPVTRSSGERLSHEEVVNKLDNDTVSYDVTLGVNGGFNETLRVTIKVETANYEVAIAWLRDLLYGSEFTKDRSVSVPHICLIDPRLTDR